MLDNFKGLKYFRPDSKTDQWGSADKIEKFLLFELDKLRERIGHPIFVTSGYRANSKESQHRNGKAVDVVCPGIPLLDFYLAAERFHFTGIGIYPDWHYNGAIVGGLHLDTRIEEPARWMGVKISQSEQSYIALNAQNLKQYGVI